MRVAGTDLAPEDGDALSIRLTPEAFARPPGGVRRTAFELLEALREEGVHVSASRFVDGSITEVSTTPSPLRRGMFQVAEAAYFAGRRFRRAHGVAHSLYYDQQVRPANWPLVVTVNDMIHERFGVGRHALRQAKKLSVRQASLIVTPSNATASDVVTFFPEARNKVVTIPWAIGSAFLTAPSRPSGEVDSPFLLYVGKRSAYKNFAVLVHALAAANDLRDLRLVLVGGGPLTEEESSDLIDGLGTKDRFVHVASLADDGLRQLYDDAAALVVTSRCEGFGLPLLEAMARGCPVACAEGGSSGEVANGHAVMFPPDSPSACADAVRAAIGLTSDARHSATLHASQYNWPSTALAHVEAYRAVQRSHR